RYCFRDRHRRHRSLPGSTSRHMEGAQELISQFCAHGLGTARLLNLVDNPEWIMREYFRKYFPEILKGFYE
ncbi:MAG: hypothetical protein VW876_09195, partial [Deltaproteobacteria bacterium]